MSSLCNLYLPDLLFVCYFVLVMNKAVIIVNLLLNINHSIIKTTIPLWNFCITNDHGYVSFVVFFSLFISSFMTYHRDGNKSNTTSVTGGTVSTHPSWALEFIPDINGVRVALSLVFCVVFDWIFNHFIVCPSSTSGFWFPFVYFQTFLITRHFNIDDERSIII